MSKVSAREIQKYNSEGFSSEADLLAREEPLEIRIGFGAEKNRQQKSLAVTMRTPGDDEHLALGFLYSEGIIQETDQIESIKHCCDLGKEESKGNVIRVELKPNATFEAAQLERNFYMTSSCGICGKASIESVEIVCNRLPESSFEISPQLLLSLPEKLRSSQSVFEHTGGIHAAGLFDSEGKIMLMAEDVGRHNALDKLIGKSLLRPDVMKQLAHSILILSGRASFELVQKAAMFRIPVVAAVGAPSSLAVDLAEKLGLSLVGFLRGGRFNLYCGSIFAEQNTTHGSSK